MTTRVYLARRIHSIDTPITPAERAPLRRNRRAAMVWACLLLAAIGGGAWGLAAVAQAERAQTSERTPA